MVWVHRQLRTGFWQGLIHGLPLTLVCNSSRHMMWGKNATHALIQQNQAGAGLCVQSTSLFFSLLCSALV